MKRRAALLAVVSTLSCQSDLTTPGVDDPLFFVARTTASAANTCPNCTFEPVTYTRQTATPVTEVIEFEGNPDGAYILETDDLRTRGAESRIVLNGERMKVRRGFHGQEVVLDWDNELTVRLTGKPGSTLSVKIYQEVFSVEVTPDGTKARIPATQQFTAIARDRNGVEIPRQTFTWKTPDPSLADLNATSGVATTVGPEYNHDTFEYWSTSTGEGTAHITAQADGTDEEGTATWQVVSGLVYTTFRPPHPTLDPPGFLRAFRYDEPRLSEMTATCGTEYLNTAWRPYALGVEREFHQCYPSLETSTPTRGVASLPNVGLYGRYCGGGQPENGQDYEGGPHGPDDWWRRPDYQPKDPIDALCMEHDLSEQHHDLDPFWSPFLAACIVRWGIENEELREEGVLLPKGSAGWDAFWNRWPAMMEARLHWIDETDGPCDDDRLEEFRKDRGLQ